MGSENWVMWIPTVFFSYCKFVSPSPEAISFANERKEKQTFMWMHAVSKINKLIMRQRGGVSCTVPLQQNSPGFDSHSASSCVCMLSPCLLGFPPGFTLFSLDCEYAGVVQHHVNTAAMRLECKSHFSGYGDADLPFHLPLLFFIQQLSSWKLTLWNHPHGYDWVAEQLLTHHQYVDWTVASDCASKGFFPTYKTEFAYSM